MKKLQLLLAALAIATVGAGCDATNETSPQADSTANAAQVAVEEASDEIEDNEGLEEEPENQDESDSGFDLVGYLEDVDDENDSVSYTITDTSITISGTGIPNHETGEFPNSGNPNTISEQDAEYTVTRNPEYTGVATDVQVPGIALNGVFIEPGTAERDQETGWAIEALQDMLDLGLDFNNAHVQPGGAYHYHGVPTSLVEGNVGHSPLIGFAADGFPIYSQYGYNEIGATVEYQSSWKLRKGERVDGPAGEYDGTYTNDFEYVAGSGDLDECNGADVVTPEYPQGTYAYFITDTFPYAPRCLFGTPDDSFAKGPNGPGASAPPTGQTPPPRR